MEYHVTQSIPSNGERVLCFGHKTFCCEEDMDEYQDWHEVIFSIVISSYRIKSSISDILEESIFFDAKLMDMWTIDEQFHVIGVTKWKEITS